LLSHHGTNFDDTRPSWASNYPPIPAGLTWRKSFRWKKFSPIMPIASKKQPLTCISLMQRKQNREDVVAALAPIVTEEWGHFRLVLAELKKRGFRSAASGKMNTSTPCSISAAPVAAEEDRFATTC
jgi:hypothetical protein